MVGEIPVGKESIDHSPVPLVFITYASKINDSPIQISG